VAKRLYVETSVVSYLTARPSRDVIRMARQQLTWEWWEHRRGEFDLYASRLVVEEAEEGGPAAAQRRLDALEGIPLLDLQDEVGQLAAALIAEGPLPDAAADDAIHLALATVYGMDFLLTWNCRHLANAELTESVADFFRARGHRAPVVCTPEELMGE